MLLVHLKGAQRAARASQHTPLVLRPALQAWSGSCLQFVCGGLGEGGGEQARGGKDTLKLRGQPLMAPGSLPEWSGLQARPRSGPTPASLAPEICRRLLLLRSCPPSTAAGNCCCSGPATPHHCCPSLTAAALLLPLPVFYRVLPGRKLSYLGTVMHPSAGHLGFSPPMRMLVSALLTGPLRRRLERPVHPG